MRLSDGEIPLQTLIWQQPDWPALHFNPAALAQALAAACKAQGVVEGKLAALGFEQHQEVAAETWAYEASSTAAIEGERLDLEAVRSSIARRLGVSPAKGALKTPRHVDGLLDLMDDAVSHATKPVTHQRLHTWQAALFPTGYSGMRPVRVGHYREHTEHMQIVSSRVGREIVHYEAPPSAAVPAEMERFLAWLESPNELHGMVKAALAHLWFETIHPYEDGNGRLGRAIVDLVLARHAGEQGRVLRISQQLLTQRDEYYAQLKRAQHGTLDVTAWVGWFMAQIRAAFDTSSSVVNLALAKARFWHQHRAKNLSVRQRKVINVLLDAGPGSFEGGMSTRKYESLTSAARATASRDLIELAALGLLVQRGAGRGTRYDLIFVAE